MYTKRPGKNEVFIQRFLVNFQNALRAKYFPITDQWRPHAKLGLQSLGYRILGPFYVAQPYWDMADMHCGPVNWFVVGYLDYSWYYLGPLSQFDLHCLV